MSLPIIGITMGDPAGIGPEVMTEVEKIIKWFLNFINILDYFNW